MHTPPDAPCLSLSQLVGAAFGAAGQRCMALSTAIFVGKSQEWIPEIVERAKQLKTNAGEGGRGRGGEVRRERWGGEGGEVGR